MKKLLLLLGILFPVSGFAQIASLTGSCVLGAQQAKTSGLPSTNFMQGVAPQCTVTVYLTGTTNLATIFKDQNSTALTNPFKANNNGQWLFYVAVNLGYDVVLSGGVPPNVYTVPNTLVGLFPATNIITPSGTPAGPAFAVNFANSLVNAFQGDSTITINPTTHTLAATNVVLTGLSSTQPVCPNGTGGALTTTGCTSGSGANPAGPAFAVNFANSTVTNFQGDSTITINPTSHAFVSPINSGFRYATGFGNGTTTGISTCASGATGLSCTADPSYPSTEQYSFIGMIPSVPSRFSFQDWRNGIQTDFHHDWAFNTSNFGSSGAIETACLTDGVSTITTGSWTRSCNAFDVVDSTPGWTLNTNQWYVMSIINGHHTVNGSGITGGLTSALTKHGIGDTDGLTIQVSGAGGYTTGSDEGTKAAAITTLEELGGPPSGACSTGCTNGSTQVKLAVTSSGWGTGRYVRNTTQAPTVATITAVAASALGGGSTVTLSGTPATASNAWGTLSGNCNQATHNPNPPFTTSTVCNVTVVSGTFDTSHLLCFKNTQHECVIPTAVTGSGTVSITMPLRGTTHPSGSYVFQGGWTGYGMEIPFYDQGVLTYEFDVVGCTTTSSCEVVQWNPTGATTLPVTTYPGWSGAGPGSANLSNLSSSGTTVSGVYVSAGSTLTLTSYNKGTILISGASDLSLNAVCTNLLFVTGTNFFTCTVAGLTSNHTSTTAAAGLSTAAGVVVSTANFRPVAAVLDVQNESLTPPSPDGTLTFEANVLAINTSDVLEEPHHEAAHFTGGSFTTSVNNPFNSFVGFNTVSSGAGAQGGAYLNIGSSPQSAFYRGQGGYLNSPNAVTVTGSYGYLIFTSEGPQTGTGILINSDTAQVNDPNYTVAMLQGTGRVGPSQFSYTPYTSAATIGGGFGSLGLSGTEIIPGGPFTSQPTFRDRIIMQALGTAGVVTLTANTYGGTLADTTQFCYYVQARNNAGIGIHGTEVCATTGTSTGNNSVKVTWTHIAGATSYDVCGRTTGAELKMTTLVGYDNTTLVDDNSLTPSGACSTTDTSLPGIDNSAYYGLLSSGTAFEGKLVAPAGVAGNYTLTLPAVTATLAALASPAFTGTPTAPTAASSDSSTTLATTAFVKSVLPVKISNSITPGAATTSQCVEQTFTYSGLLTTEQVSVSPPALGAHIWIGYSRVSSTNVLAIDFCADATGGTPAAGTYIAVAF